MINSLLTCEQVAVELEVTVATLQLWRTRGKGPRFVKIGRTCKYRPEDLNAWLASQTFGSLAEVRAAKTAAVQS